ncbi:MAG: 2OG-Fe(II) oxygenase family protein [Burkholderiales bacterium]
MSQDDWACAAIANVFSDSFYGQLVQGLASITWSEAVQEFYRQREADLRGITCYDELFNEYTRAVIAGAVGRFFGMPISPDFDVAAHKMIPGDFIGVHTDANTFRETHRMTITLNDNWSVDEGGVLLALNGGDLRSIRDAWLPTANNGFLFEVSERSFHAVTPVIGKRPRYSLILTFKALQERRPDRRSWVPFVLEADLEDARSTALHMGISYETFSCPYQYLEFDDSAAFRSFLGGRLENAPDEWSYRHGYSVNVDELGRQPKGTDEERLAIVYSLRRIPPIIVVRRKSHQYCLVDGSHRLSLANDDGMSIGVALFDER